MQVEAGILKRHKKHRFRSKILMGKTKFKGPDGKKLWSSGLATMTADKNLDIILGSVVRLPLRNWRKNFFFTGAKDEEFLELTENKFPLKSVPNKRHPVFAIKSLPENAGFKVCPCSSKQPSKKREYRYIKKGCRLLYTNHLMDRHSYLVEEVSFNIPQSIACILRFRGEVPNNCIKSVLRNPVNP